MFDLDLSVLKINANKIEILKQMEIHTIEDLIRYYPTRYEILEEIPPVLMNEKVMIECVIVEEPKVFFIRPKMSRMTFRVRYHNETYLVSIFNRHFLRAKLTLGTTIFIIGKLQGNASILASDLKIQSLESLQGIYPIYTLKQGITNKSMQGYIKKAYKFIEKDLIDFIPEEYLQEYHLVYLKEALYEIHFPSNKEKLKQAIKYLKYEEFFKFELMMLFIKSKHQEIDSGIAKIYDQEKLNDYILNLPFRFTDDQNKVTKEILQDLTQNKLMDRLVQGDVGSGKTVVASVAIYATYLAGYQSAMMAPTEILATQHFNTLKNLFANTPIRIELLVGSLTTSQKKEIYHRLAIHEIDLVIGTHALIQQAVTFKKLGLVIADEQHRFGVNQRKLLQDKGEKVDLLTMSATPIPRTIAMVLYGDKDLSTIHTMPKNRKTTITKVIQTKTMKPILKQLESYVDQGGQCYVVCPLVEENETLPLQSATKIYQGMQNYYKNRYHVGLLHGKQSDQEKEEVMQKFIDHQIDILVSTTVIEVGVDVGNANMMVIYDAQRFGLSQLHQLRGRVGRSNKQGYCFLFSTSQDEEASQRLSFLEKESDGFKIAEFDLKLRGPGELLGNKQSGLPSFLIADVLKDFNILEHARQDAGEIIGKINEEKYYLILKDLKKKIENNTTYLD